MLSTLTSSNAEIKKRQPIRGRVIISLVVFGVMLTAFFLFSNWYRQRLIIEKRCEISRQLLAQRAALSSSLDRCLMALEGLTIFVETNSGEDDFDRRFYNFADGLRGGVRDIISLTAAPEKSRHLTVPNSNSESIFWTFFLNKVKPQKHNGIHNNDPDSRISLDGPFTIHKDAKFFVASRDIFIKNVYWGVAAAAIDLNALYDNSVNDDFADGFLIALRMPNGEILAGSALQRADNPATCDVQAAGGYWILEASPEKGWNQAVQNDMSVVRYSGTAVVILAVVISFLLANRNGGPFGKGESHSNDAYRLNDDMANLLKNEERYRRLFELGGIGCAITDMNRRWVNFNDKLCDMLGYSRDELERMTWAEITHPDDLEADLERYNRILTGEIESYDLDKRFIRQDGKILHSHITITCLRDQEGNPEYFIGNYMDLTDRVIAEEEKNRLSAQLLHSQKMEAVGTLAGGVAHDFNNMLGAIIGFSELSLYEDNPTDTIKSNLEQVLKAGQRAKDLVQQILTFSRKTEEEQSVLDVRPLIKESVKFLRSSLPTTIDIRFSDKAIKTTILGNPSRTQQVLMNLCTNAAHSMKEHGGVLELGLYNRYIGEEELSSWETEKAGEFLCVEVKDTGHGIEKEILDRIFEPYFTTKKKEEGAGLGLAVVHGIVKSHGGAVNVYSEPGKGSTFKVLFPVAEQAPAGQEKLEKALPAGSERILLVDDEEALADMGRQMLERLGYKVEVYHNGVDALEAFQIDPEKYDMLITDQTMPQLTGSELAKILLAAVPNLPVILCTGYSDTLTEEDVGEIGIKALILKPFNYKKLAMTIRDVLDGRA